jgi:hypothetical protein
LIAILLLLVLTVGVNAQAVATNFTWVVTKLLTVTDTATFTSGVNVAGTLSASGGIDAAGTVVDTLIVEGNGDVVGNFEVADHLLTQAELYMIPPATLTITDGATIVPTGVVMELTSAGAVGAELSTAGDGQLLILVNVGAQTITISDTATIESTGDIALGQYDTLTLIGSGVKWYQVAASNN